MTAPNGGIISLWCELFTIFIFVLLIVLSFVSDIFYPDGGIISLWCELFTIFIFVLLIVLSFVSDIFYPDDDICKYWKLDFTMTIYLFNAVSLFYSRIFFKKLDDSAKILFRKVEKTFKNATKLRTDINFHFLLLILSCSITTVQHFRLDYSENFELAWKETIDKLIWNMCGFWKYYHVLSKHWQPSCSIVNVRMRRHGLGKRYLQE